MPDIVTTITDFLKEEKWTRTTISEFSISTFENYDKIIDDIFEKGNQTEIVNFLENYIKQSRNSIIALYFLSVILARDGSYESIYAERLINVFKENHKQGIIKYLCEKYLQYGNYKSILSDYIDILEKEGVEEEKLVDYWKKLAKLDYSDIKTTKKLAEYFETLEDRENAIFYYKKLIEYSILKKNFTNIETYFKKLLELNDEDEEYFFNILGKINTPYKAMRFKLGEILIEYYKGKENYQAVVEAIKMIYKLIPNKYKDTKAIQLRGELIEAYRKIYSNNSQFEVCLKRSQLNMKWKDLYSAIAIFEKYIPFDKGTWVYHTKGGIGYIKGIENDFLVIDFDSKKNHRMKIDMALTSLKILPDDHILVINKINKGELEKIIDNEPGKFVKMILKALGGKASSTEMKKFIVSNKVCDPKRWSTIWEKAKNQLKTDPLFAKSLNKNNIYILRDKPVSFEDSLLEEFKAYDNLIDKARVCRRFLEEGGDYQHDNFQMMLKYFQNLIVADLEVSPNFILSYIFMQDLKKLYPELNINLPYKPQQLFKNIAEYGKFYFPINDSFFEKKYFNYLRMYIDNWKEVMANYLVKYPTKYVLNILINEKCFDLINLKIKEVEKSYREKPHTFLWFCKNLIFADYDIELEVEDGEIILLLINLLDYSNRAIIQKIELANNRKIFNSIIEILFKDKVLENFINSTSNKEKVKKMALMFFRIKDMKEEYIRDFKVILYNKFPEILSVHGEKDVEDKNTFYSTAASIEEKKNYLQHLISVEIPNTNKEMALAKEKGDLRENAEYISAREKLQHLNEEAALLQTEINNAIAIDPKMIKTDNVNIGTKVKIHVKEDNKYIEYTILGKWDVDLSKNIISYETAIGQLLLGKKVGDTFKNPSDKKTYVIKKIEKAL